MGADDVGLGDGDAVDAGGVVTGDVGAVPGEVGAVLTGDVDRVGVAVVGGVDVPPGAVDAALVGDVWDVWDVDGGVVEGCVLPSDWGAVAGTPLCGSGSGRTSR
ncbi:MAG: hypothetical protein ACR2JU_05780 [Nocardioidaceae bacterium]